MEFMAFPKIKDIPSYEEAPMDVFMIPKNTKNMIEAKAFIKFMSNVDVQSKHSKNLGYLSPHKDGIVGDDKFIQSGKEILKNAKGVSQYFDRDTLPAFEKKAMPILTEFLNSGNLKDVTHKLEKARKEVFINK